MTGQEAPGVAALSDGAGLETGTEAGVGADPGADAGAEADVDTEPDAGSPALLTLLSAPDGAVCGPMGCELPPAPQAGQ